MVLSGSDDDSSDCPPDMEDFDDLDADLALMAAAHIDAFQLKIDASEEVKNCIDAYFEISNVASETDLSEVECALCGEQAYLAVCTATSGAFPKLTILSTTCPACGHKKACVRSGTAKTQHTPLKLTLKINTKADLERDILKSEHATLEIPELGLELTRGTLGSTYTTIGALLNAVIEDIGGQHATFVGDESKMKTFIDTMRDLTEVKTPWTIILDDPMGYVFVGRLSGEEEEKDQVLLETYEDRTKIPEDNKPDDYAETEEYLAAETERLGIRIGEASYKEAGRAAFAIKPFKRGQLVGCMFGSFGTDFVVSDRLVECEALKYRFKTNVYLDGAPMCPVTFINDPSFGNPRKDQVQSNCLFVTDDRKEPSDMGYLSVYAARDIEASPEAPVELWMEYRPTEFSALPAADEAETVAGDPEDKL